MLDVPTSLLSIRLLLHSQFRLVHELILAAASREPQFDAEGTTSTVYNCSSPNVCLTMEATRSLGENNPGPLLTVGGPGHECL